MASPPLITAQPQSLLVSNGNPAAFTVAVSGATPLLFIWQKNQAALSDGGNVSGSATANLSLSPTTVNDEGNYCVIISNAWGVVTSAVVTLNDAAAPVIAAQPQNATAPGGTSTNFTAAAVGGLPSPISGKRTAPT